MAIAVLEEKKAAEQDARVQVVLAEKEIPLALSEALRNGNLGIYDFEKLKNIQSDTKMRSSIATSDFFKSSKKQESKTVTEKQNLEKNR